MVLCYWSVGTVDRWQVYTGIDHHNDGVVDDYAGGGDSGDGGGDAYGGGGGDGGGDAYGGRGVDQTYGSQVCLRSAMVGTVQVVH